MGNTPVGRKGLVEIILSTYTLTTCNTSTLSHGWHNAPCLFTASCYKSKAFREQQPDNQPLKCYQHFLKLYHIKPGLCLIQSKLLNWKLDFQSLSFNTKWRVSFALVSQSFFLVKKKIFVISCNLLIGVIKAVILHI